MSLMDVLFGSPMASILQQMPVADAVSDALLERKGIYGDMLDLCEYLERIDESGPLLLPALQRLNLSIDELYRLELSAFEWANAISGVV
jgi:EAL and modified HD-GYP domain-containing signal transduction protein